MTEIQKICVLGSARILRKVPQCMNRMIDLSDLCSRYMICAWLTYKKNTSKDCDKRDKKKIIDT